MDRELVCNQHLLGKSKREYCQTERDVVPINAITRTVADLRTKLIPSHNRSGDKMGKERHEHCVKLKARHPPPSINLDQKCDLDKRREGKRKRHVGRSRGVPVDHREEKIGIFEIAEHKQVCDDTEDQTHTGARAFLGSNTARD